jgi:catechol 2,3-dioxygenase-like lactoylglutathione lyase family enzyme
MKPTFERLKKTYDSTPVSRRAMLGALPALAIASRHAIGGPQAPGSIPVERLHSFGLSVGDVNRSVEFYQGLFGMPIQARQGAAVWLQMGAGPQFISLRPLEPGENPSITHMCYTTPGFDADGIMSSLLDHGFERIDSPTVDTPGIENAMSAWIRTRRGTPELYFADANGLIVQLQDPRYCGGGGPLGDMCTPTNAPSPGLIAIKDLSHFTVFGSTGGNDFYQSLFGLGIQAYQGPTAPVLGVGDGIQFMMFAGGGGGGRGRGGGAATPTPANIHHACMNMDNFEVEAVQAALEEHGIQPREEGSNATPPLIHYISLRMPNRGGAEGGTPELYFTDPDGLLMQLQDTSYCGGGGYLGNACG